MCYNTLTTYPLISIQLKLFSRSKAANNIEIDMKIFKKLNAKNCLGWKSQSVITRFDISFKSIAHELYNGGVLATHEQYNGNLYCSDWEFRAYASIKERMKKLRKEKKEMFFLIIKFQTRYNINEKTFIYLCNLFTRTDRLLFKYN